MKILHVMSEFPYPPDNGSRADIWGRLQTMSHLGHSIDALVMSTKRVPRERDTAEVRRFVNSLQFVDRRPMRQCLATLAPTSVACNKPLAEVPLREQYDITIAEGDSLFPIFENPGLQTAVRALRVHNNESIRMWASAQTEEGFLRRQLCRLEALRFLPFSRSAYSRVDSLWFISQSEYQDFETAQPAATSKIVWLPPSLVFGSEPKRCTARSKRVLFVASFHITLNREALRWYLREVHPRLTQDPEYELVVVGSTNERPCAQQFTEEIKRERRCSVHVNIEDLTPLYDECALFVNPMQRGAGVKLKNIHAIERRIPVVTTSIGNDGSGFMDRQHVRVADTPSDFASAITDILNNYSMGGLMAERAHCYLTKNYDCHANILRLFSSLMPKSPWRPKDEVVSSRIA